MIQSVLTRNQIIAHQRILLPTSRPDFTRPSRPACAGARWRPPPAAGNSRAAVRPPRSRATRRDAARARSSPAPRDTLPSALRSRRLAQRRVEQRASDSAAPPARRHREIRDLLLRRRRTRRQHNPAPSPSSLRAAREVDRGVRQRLAKRSLRPRIAERARARSPRSPRRSVERRRRDRDALITLGSGRPCADSHFTCASASRPYAGSQARDVDRTAAREACLESRHAARARTRRIAAVDAVGLTIVRAELAGDARRRRPRRRAEPVRSRRSRRSASTSYSPT